MIDDSVPWRQELLKSAARLRRWESQQRWTSRTYYLAERDIMMGAYSIRRLIDSRKCSMNLPKKPVRVQRYMRTGRTPMVLDRFSPELFYDLAHPRAGELSVARLCNQFIHSFVFQIVSFEDGSTCAVFVSDHDRSKELNGITFGGFADLLDYVGREDIVTQHGTMIDGEQIFENLSNHDLVESGNALYIDDARVAIERNDDAQAFESLRMYLAEQGLNGAASE